MDDSVVEALGIELMQCDFIMMPFLVVVTAALHQKCWMAVAPQAKTIFLVEHIRRPFERCAR